MHCDPTLVDIAEVGTLNCSCHSFDQYFLFPFAVIELQDHPEVGNAAVTVVAVVADVVVVVVAVVVAADAYSTVDAC